MMADGVDPATRLREIEERAEKERRRRELHKADYHPKYMADDIDFKQEALEDLSWLLARLRELEAENETLKDDFDALRLSWIELTNPGIDMDMIRAQLAEERAAG